MRNTVIFLCSFVVCLFCYCQDRSIFMNLMDFCLLPGFKEYECALWSKNAKGLFIFLSFFRAALPTSRACNFEETGLCFFSISSVYFFRPWIKCAFCVSRRKRRQHSFADCRCVDFRFWTWWTGTLAKFLILYHYWNKKVVTQFRENTQSLWLLLQEIQQNTKP